MGRFWLHCISDMNRRPMVKLVETEDERNIFLKHVTINLVLLRSKLSNRRWCGVWGWDLSEWLSLKGKTSGQLSKGGSLKGQNSRAWDWRPGRGRNELPHLQNYPFQKSKKLSCKFEDLMFKRKIALILRVGEEETKLENRHTYYLKTQCLYAEMRVN